VIIDTHLHLWRRGRGDYGWLEPDGGPLDRDFGAADALAEMRGAGVDKAILVQAAPTVAESLFLLDIARANQWVAGVIGWADLTASSVSEDLALLAASGPLVGIRPMLQGGPDPAWLLRADVGRGLDAAERAGLVFDALIRPHQFGAIVTAARQRPHLPIVLDHGGKPPMDGSDLDAWAASIAMLAALPNTACKLSGLLSEAGADWCRTRLAEIIDVLIDVFGPERLIWGSDWPVCAPAIDYGTWSATCRTLLALRLDTDGIAKIFGGNAAAIYQPGKVQ